MQVSWLLPKITKALYSSLPHVAVFVLLHNTLLSAKPSEKITDISGGGVMTSTTFDKARWQGRGSALCGGNGYFLKWHIWTDWDRAMVS